MKFTYYELVKKPLEIDFDKLYEIMTNELSKDIFYDEFCDNVDYYIKELCNIELDYECNISLYDEILDAWEEYLNNKNDNSN